MTKFKDQIRKPESCYFCRHNTIMNEGQENERWECDELYGVSIGTNPPYDEPCYRYQEKPKEEREDNDKTD